MIEINRRKWIYKQDAYCKWWIRGRRGRAQHKLTNIYMVWKTRYKLKHGLREKNINTKIVRKKNYFVFGLPYRHL